MLRPGNSCSAARRLTSWRTSVSTACNRKQTRVQNSWTPTTSCCEYILYLPIEFTREQLRWTRPLPLGRIKNQIVTSLMKLVRGNEGIIHLIMRHGAQLRFYRSNSTHYLLVANIGKHRNMEDKQNTCRLIQQDRQKDTNLITLLDIGAKVKVYQREIRVGMTGGLFTRPSLLTPG